MNTETTATEFLTAGDKERMIGHMNDDHADAVLNYVRAFTGARAAEAARLLDIDRYAMSVEYHTGQGRNICRIPFERPLQSQDEVRSTLVRLAQLARERLGLNPEGVS